MITTLHVGMRVMLPSGNVLVLARRERASWICEFVPGCKARGEVEFTGAWLRRWARQV
jgi:hypothetical protein